jgi:integrase
VRAGKLMRERNIKAYFSDYREELEKKGIAPLTVKGRMTVISSFYKSNNIDLPVIPRSINKAKPQKKRRAIPTKEDLQYVLDFCDPLERALLLVGVSSGLAINEISELTVGDFLDGYDEETGVTTLNLIRKKVNYEFTTFLSREASKAVKAYLDWRGREGVNTDHLMKQRVTTKEGYLFISRAVPDEFLKIKKEKDKEKLRQLDVQSIMGIYRRLSEEANKSAPYGEWNLLRSHNMRRFFNSQLLNANASVFFVDFCMGHTLDAVHDGYFRCKPDELKKTYLQYEPYITIQKEVDISESPEYLRIKQENQILQGETARHIVERSELQELRAEIGKVKEMKSIKADYMQFADFDEMNEMKNAFRHELEEISKLKEMMLKTEK